MQAIVTKYVGPTNFRPGRIIAKCDERTFDHRPDGGVKRVRIID